MGAVWEDLATAEDLSVLAPGDEIDARPDLLVVGGGIIGLAVAAMGRLEGLRVTLLERGERLAAGTSGSAAGGLSPDAHLGVAPEPWVRLARESLALHRALASRWGYELRPMDMLVALPGAPDGGSGLELLTPEGSPPKGLEILEPPAAGRIEPALGEVGTCVRLAEQAHVDPLGMAAGLARRAGTVATGVEVTGVEMRGGRVVRVATDHGHLEPGAVVFATGLAPSALLDALDIVQEPVKGHLIATEPAPFGLRVGLASGAALVFQTSDGRLIAGGTLDHDDRSLEPRREVVERVRAEMERLLPAAAELSVTHTWCCFRPSVGDGMPVVDRVPGCDNAWFACGMFRTGLLVAPAVGWALASWVVEGSSPALVRPFALDRLSYR